ncbi:MAG: hypothetical protein RSB90_09715, partial [Eubacterium sp.]
MLKGKSVIELRNAETGKIEQVVKDENMVTNAVSNILNYYDQYNGYYSDDSGKVGVVTRVAFTPILKTCFGGILL